MPISGSAQGVGRTRSASTSNAQNYVEERRQVGAIAGRYCSSRGKGICQRRPRGTRGSCSNQAISKCGIFRSNRHCDSNRIVGLQVPDTQSRLRHGGERGTGLPRRYSPRIFAVSVGGQFDARSNRCECESTGYDQERGGANHFVADEESHKRHGENGLQQDGKTADQN